VQVLGAAYEFRPTRNPERGGYRGSNIAVNYREHQPDHTDNGQRESEYGEKTRSPVQSINTDRSRADNQTNREAGPTPHLCRRSFPQPPIRE
jgi:hypothetical protein